MRKKLLTLSKSNALIFKVDTTKAGISDSYSFRIPTIGGGYNYTVDWGDGFVNTGVTGNITHTYSTQGIKIIKITGVFPRFYFANSGDKLKLLSIINWGNITYSTVQNYAFWGCTNLTSIAYGEWLNTITNGDIMFSDCTSLTTLPSSITFASLTNGDVMFNGSSITNIPNSITFANVTSGDSMFRDCTSLTTLPSSITFANVTNGGGMFNACASLTTLPSSITFASLTSGSSMFRNCTSLTTLPSSITFASLTNGVAMFSSIINKSNYSQLLINIASYNTNNNVTFNGGGSKYNTAGQTARNQLTGVQGWVITDGGYEP